MNTFERLESEVRSYCRAFPTVFATAHGHTLVDEGGREYIDFFAGAGALNYGHNPEPIKQALLAYVESGGITHSLDLHTSAKRRFLETLDEVILQPRGLEYKVMFPGPTGTNAVEAALKLARKVTGRTGIISFTNGFHGMTLGSLAITGNSGKRAGAGVPLGNATAMPFCGYLGEGVDTIAILEQYLGDSSSGVELPAAFIIETVQAEGGIHPASLAWLRRLQALARRHDILLIADDIQVGCGRTGKFFSFEDAGLEPDIVCLSKSLSGYGVPFAVVLIKPEHDQFSPGEHNGTFRGHNLAFVTATAALEGWWRTSDLSDQVAAKAERVGERLREIAGRTRHGSVRGRGLIQGIAYDDPELAGQVSVEAFKRGLVIETAGPNDEVLKLLPPLTIEMSALNAGIDIIEQSVNAVLARAPGKRPAFDPTPAEAK